MFITARLILSNAVNARKFVIPDSALRFAICAIFTGPPTDFAKSAFPTISCQMELAVNVVMVIVCFTPRGNDSNNPYCLEMIGPLYLLPTTIPMRPSAEGVTEKDFVTPFLFIFYIIIPKNLVKYKEKVNLQLKNAID